MPTVKCFNPQCDYFQKPIPEGDFCPFCGEALNLSYTSTPNTPSPQPEVFAPPPEFHPRPLSADPIPSSGNFTGPPPVSPTPKKPGATYIEQNLFPILKIVHTGSGEKFTIRPKTVRDKVYLGRPDYSEILPGDVVDLTTIPYGERISRYHAYIYWDVKNNSYFLVDNNSTNGTILNEISLIPNKAYALNSGDKIELGKEQKVIFIVEI